MFLIMSMFRPDYMGIPLIMGSPLYGYGRRHQHCLDGQPYRRRRAPL